VNLLPGSGFSARTALDIFSWLFPHLNSTVHNITVAAGDIITDAHDNGRSSVVVLGANVATTLFPDGDTAGQSIRING
jgi:hypothetical protein